MIAAGVTAGKSILTSFILIALATGILAILMVLINLAGSMTSSAINATVLADLLALVQMGLPFNLNQMLVQIFGAVGLYFVIKYGIMAWVIAKGSLHD